MKNTEYAKDLFFRKLKKSILIYKKVLPLLKVYGDTKNTKYTRFDFRKYKTSILTYKKGL